MQPRSSRLDALYQIFAMKGMSPTAASDLSCQLVLQHPLAGRIGVDELSRVISDRGMAKSDARDTALTILAVEFFDCGAQFREALRELEKWQREPGEALVAALEGSRIVRGSGVEEIGRDEVTAQMIFALNSMGVACVAAAILLAIIGG